MAESRLVPHPQFSLLKQMKRIRDIGSEGYDAPLAWQASADLTETKN
jgi:hypothetical protein